ncbi:MAG: hypothetical protein SPI97_07460 [Oscillospiraceae bacterium]|nr:hypothetical protein [Oscillospiraceae bacterium]
MDSTDKLCFFVVFGNTLCNHYGNIDRYNCISDIGSGDFTPHGIYFDDNSSGQTAYGNILINIPGYAILVGGGRDNCLKTI